jgi:hypothetical protein
MLQNGLRSTLTYTIPLQFQLPKSSSKLLWNHQRAKLEKTQEQPHSHSLRIYTIKYHHTLGLSPPSSLKAVLSRLSHDAVPLYQPPSPLNIDALAVMNSIVSLGLIFEKCDRGPVLPPHCHDGKMTLKSSLLFSQLQEKQQLSCECERKRRFSVIFPNCCKDPWCIFPFCT